jgi:hypothetical protein
MSVHVTLLGKYEPAHVLITFQTKNLYEPLSPSQPLPIVFTVKFYLNFLFNYVYNNSSSFKCE